jgi:hydroxymethylbilane synthase
VLRIATRKSPLAMWQAEHVATLLQHHGVETSLVPLVSSGDVDMRPIDGKRQVGVFTKRIQQALLDDEADVAVHSMKDLPTEVDERLTVAAIPERETVADCLVSNAAWSIDGLPRGAKIGTGSKRRAAQLLSLRHPIDSWQCTNTTWQATGRRIRRDYLGKRRTAAIKDVRLEASRSTFGRNATSARTRGAGHRSSTE